MTRRILCFVAKRIPVAMSAALVALIEYATRFPNEQVSPGAANGVHVPLLKRGIMTDDGDSMLSSKQISR
jgi:hypothetical protein